jgi:hypothetical protein
MRRGLRVFGRLSRPIELYQLGFDGCGLCFGQTNSLSASNHRRALRLSIPDHQATLSPPYHEASDGVRHWLSARTASPRGDARSISRLTFLMVVTRIGDFPDRMRPPRSTDHLHEPSICTTLYCLPLCSIRRLGYANRSAPSLVKAT